jgi:hypothetical protein
MADFAGVNGFIAIRGSVEAAGTFLVLEVNRLKKNVKPKLPIFFHCFRETRFISGKSFYPSLFLEFFCSGHQIEFVRGLRLEV